MNPVPGNERWEERKVIDYLLGRLDTAGQEAMEEQLLLDPEFHQLVLNTEIDLMREYIAEQLPAGDVRAFEKHFLRSQANRDRVRLMRNLYDLSARQSRTRLLWLAGVGWAACLMVGTGLVWQLANQSPVDHASSGEAKRVTVASTTGAQTLEATLRAGGNRQAENNQPNGFVVSPAPDARLVRLWLVPAEAFHGQGTEHGLRAVFLNDSRREVAVLPVHFGGSGETLYVECPVSVFEPGHYILELRTGSGSVLEAFAFRALAK